MAIITFIILLGLYLLLLVISFFATKYLLQNDSSKRAKLFASLSYSFGISLCIFSTSTISPSATLSLSNLDGSPLHILSIFPYLFMWTVSSGLWGATFAVITTNISAILALILKEDISKLDSCKGFGVAMWTSLLSGAIGCGYIFMLTVLGLSPSFPIFF